MDLRIKATDYTLTEETQNYLETRLESLTKLLSNNETVRFEVELGRDAGRPRHGKNIWFAEIQILVPGERTVRATNRAETVNAAIDDAKEEVERQLRKKKMRDTRMMRRIGAQVKSWMWWGNK